MNCPVCKVEWDATNVMGLQYPLDHPHHYDGVSEWHCECGARINRWTGEPLVLGEVAKR